MKIVNYINKNLKKLKKHEKRNGNSEDYYKILHAQCMKYAKKHFRIVVNRSDITIEDVVQEMVTLLIQSYINGNGMLDLIAHGKLIPRWQLRLIFLNALREMDIVTSYQEKQIFNHPNPGVVVYEDGEVVDYYLPIEPESEYSYIRETMTKEQKKQWLQEIERLQRAGYTEKQIIQLLQSMAMKLKNSDIKPEQETNKEPAQMALF